MVSEFRFSTEFSYLLLVLPNLTFYFLWNCGKGRPFSRGKTEDGLGHNLSPTISLRESERPATSLASGPSF